MASLRVDPTPLRLEVRRRLSDLSTAWDELIDRQELPSPFMKSWWLDSAGGPDTAIVCLFERQDFVGGAAFEIDRLGRGPASIERVRVVGQGPLSPDHVDVIHEPGHGDRITAATIDWLRRPGSRVVDLDGLAGDGLLAAALRSHEINRLVAPYARLDLHGPDYLSSRPGKVRSTVSRGAKRLHKLGVGHRAVEVSRFDEALDRLAELHDIRWAEDSQFLRAFDRLRGSCIAGAAKDEVQLHELVAESGEAIAIELDLIAGNRVCFYQAGRLTEREWRGSGTVLRTDVIRAAIERGHTEYDMLRGDEAYKADWATDTRALVRCRFGSGTSGTVVATAANAWRRSQPTFASTKSRVAKMFNREAWRSRPGSRSERSR